MQTTPIEYLKLALSIALFPFILPNYVDVFLPFLEVRDILLGFSRFYVRIVLHIGGLGFF